METCFGNPLGFHVAAANGIEVKGTETGLPIWMSKKNDGSSKVKERYFYISKIHIGSECDACFSLVTMTFTKCLNPWKTMGNNEERCRHDQCS